jgi:hypothetical protein
VRGVALVLVLVSVGAAACGGDSGGSDTAAAPATQTAGPPTTAAGTTTEVDAVDALGAYLDAVESEQKQYEGVRKKARSGLNRVNPNGPNQSWITAADELREARDGYNELAVRMKGIEPPAELGDAHDGLAKSLQLFAQFVDQAQSDLRGKNVEAVLGWQQTLNPLGQRVNELRGDWRVETLAYAREIGADVPGWVGKVGTSG